MSIIRTPPDYQIKAATPVAALAAPASTVDVNGVTLDANTTSAQCGNGTATFDPTTGTLTLENATITKVKGSYHIYATDALTIVLKGKNKIESSIAESGIETESYLTINAGAGASLDIILPDRPRATLHGIRSLSTLTINGGEYNISLSSTKIPQM